MSKAQLCPVCGGSGRVSNDNKEPWSKKGEDDTCHGCGGKGWVTVRD